jgi:heme-degrading monooxygenase HmoA
MFVNIVKFPPIKPDKDTEFQEWFAWSNAEYAKHKGFIRRRLLKPREGGTYAAIVEHESYETFMAMHTGSTQAEARKRVDPFFAGKPIPSFYEVIVG